MPGPTPESWRLWLECQRLAKKQGREPEVIFGNSVAARDAYNRLNYVHEDSLTDDDRKALAWSRLYRQRV